MDQVQGITYLGERWEVTPYRHISGLYNPIIPISAMIDIGPGIINSEAWQIRKHHPNLLCIGIEPWEPRYKDMVSTYPGILLHAAAHSSSGSLTIYRGDDAHGQPDLACPYDTGSESVTVKAVTVDEIVEKYNLSENIFLYVGGGAGWEEHILRGAAQSLKMGLIRYLALEVWGAPPASDRLEWPIASILTPILQHYGFQCPRVRAYYKGANKLLYKLRYSIYQKVDEK